MIWHDVEQNTDEWEALRMGKFTASMFKDLLSGKSTAGYNKAIQKVAYERLTLESPETFRSDYMDRGHEMEPFAVREYERQNLCVTTMGGFFEMDEFTGCSPDRLVNGDGILQIKSPAYNTMMTYLMDKEVPSEYRIQLQGELYVTGRKWVDFMAYHPNLPSLVVRVKPDLILIPRIKTELEIAIKEANKWIETISSQQ